MPRLESWFRAGFTLIAILIALWWLAIVKSRLGTVPVRDAQGNVIDEYQRAKDILVFVLPIMTTAFGYWFGVQGKATAEQKADKTQQQLTAVLDSSPETGLLELARAAQPKAFE